MGDIGAYPSTFSPPSLAVVFEQHGSPDEVARVIELPPVEIKENEVCVKMLASPINPSDINMVQGVYPIKVPLPAVGGHEGVGEVHAFGSAVKGLSLGDWVIPSPPSFGTWQTYIVKEASAWHKINKNVPLDLASTVTVNPLTALLLLDDFAKVNGKNIPGIVGQCVIQLSKAGSDDVKERLKKLGADEVYTESQLQVKNVKGLLFVAICYGALPEPALGFNCVSGNSATLVLKFLRQGGTNVTYGECRVLIDYLLSLMQEGNLKYETELVPFDKFPTTLDKALGKLGSHPKQILKFEVHETKS
ncbi:hypothetical protein MKW92_011847 [Papaver armeniacum]|nr:hypothetical protein MKW92_011847 [Papaver armeniacum]